MQHLTADSCLLLSLQHSRTRRGSKSLLMWDMLHSAAGGENQGGSRTVTRSVPRSGLRATGAPLLRTHTGAMALH
jgi:hypothetical protein